jgi:hypothetical protein
MVQCSAVQVGGYLGLTLGVSLLDLGTGVRQLARQLAGHHLARHVARRGGTHGTGSGRGAGSGQIKNDLSM